MVKIVWYNKYNKSKGDKKIMKLQINKEAERNLLEEWGLEYYGSIKEVLEDREALEEENGYDIDAFASDVLELAYNL